MEHQESSRPPSTPRSTSSSAVGSPSRASSLPHVPRHSTWVTTSSRDRLPRRSACSALPPRSCLGVQQSPDHRGGGPEPAPLAGPLQHRIGLDDRGRRPLRSAGRQLDERAVHPQDRGGDVSPTVSSRRMLTANARGRPRTGRHRLEHGQHRLGHGAQRHVVRGSLQDPLAARDPIVDRPRADQVARARSPRIRERSRCSPPFGVSQRASSTSSISAHCDASSHLGHVHPGARQATVVALALEHLDRALSHFEHLVDSLGGVDERALIGELDQHAGAGRLRVGGPGLLE